MKSKLQNNIKRLRARGDYMKMESLLALELY